MSTALEAPSDDPSDLRPAEEEEELGDDGEDEDEDEVENNDDEEESDFTGASDLEEEAKYEDQPACGLSPRIVLRRGVETLRALDPPAPASSSNDQPLKLKRVDTVAGFETAVDGADVGIGLTSSAPPLSRVETMSGLPEVREAFAAVGEDDARPASAAAPSSSMGATTTALPTVVRRVDTMELLQDLDAEGGEGGEGDPQSPTKRQRSAV